MTQFIKLRARFVARQRGLRTVTVIMDYAQKTGRWPESLETLGGNNIIDPLTGAPFFYRRIQDSFIL